MSRYRRIFLPLHICSLPAFFQPQGPTWQTAISRPPAYHSGEGGPRHNMVRQLQLWFAATACVRLFLGGGGVSTLAAFDKDACLFAFALPSRTAFGATPISLPLRQASSCAKMGRGMTTVVLKRPNPSNVSSMAPSGGGKHVHS
jgi:hypothetical protein